MKKKWIAVALAAVLAAGLLAGCGKEKNSVDLILPPTAEAASRRGETGAPNPFGNAFRGYSMTMQIFKDSYIEAEGGGRALQLRGSGYSADIWNYASFLNAVDKLLDVYPSDTELLGLHANMVEGLDYFGRYFLRSDARSQKWQGKIFSTQTAQKKFTSNAVISYDDSVHSAARVLLDYYQRTRDRSALEKAKNQCDFLIEDAYIKTKGIEAFYWCDDSEDSKPTIVSPNVNALIAVEFLRLYQFLEDAGLLDADDVVKLDEDELASGMWLSKPETGETQKYLYYAQKAYRYCDELCRDSSIDNYYLQRYAYYSGDGSKVKGNETHVGVPHPTYDMSVTGFMIQAAVAFYEFSGDETYLDRAVRDAIGGHNYFRQEYDFDGEKVDRYVIENIWIGQTYIWGLYELSQYRYQETEALMRNFGKTMDYAYEHTLVDNYISPYFVTGWFENDVNCANYRLLDSSGAASIYTFLALWEKGIYQKDVKLHGFARPGGTGEQ